MNKALMVIAVACAVAGIAKAEHFQCGDGRCKVIADDDNPIAWTGSGSDWVALMKPSRRITVRGDGDRTATIDFTGDHVVYGGDLPVDEAAKVFFESVMVYSQAKDCPKAEGR